ncbi:unnamed protein product [Rotaria magnacalcarata]|uniref:Uncharacterized protein n=1 Tax=Rotaria magnacalcarata TaxID=392030 RepID=A0A819Z333_9BILA|nr:unnamed protein product [Rotaria magnacalcarata]
MAAISNTLVDTYSYPELETTATSQTQATDVPTEHLHTLAIAEDIGVNSFISSEAQTQVIVNKKLDIHYLLPQLSTTHAQVDQYCRALTNELNQQIKMSVTDVLVSIQNPQEQLLLDKNHRHSIIENEYKLQLQSAAETLGSVKAQNLSDLEHDLVSKQQIIISEAKQLIDALITKANTDNLRTLVEIQNQAEQDIKKLTEQFIVLDSQESKQLLKSTATTIITYRSLTAKNPIRNAVDTTVLDMTAEASEVITSIVNSTNIETEIESMPENEIA